MSKIKILPEILSNKIAAGEVIERPASVVKELVENSLDAQSSRIIVEIEKGGRSLIRVSDNGIGMSHDDALLALERYATSKIYKDLDLFSIHTLGFRGEALPSIASVSRFSLVTRENAADVGTEIIVDGGKIKKVSEIGAPPGTMVTVKQLFFNTPARRKFLKSVGTETGHIADIVANTALARPAVQFQLIHNRKTVKSWPSTTHPFDRVVEVVGQDLAKELYPIGFDGGGISISGWICSPRVTRTTSRGLNVYVNHRFVRDRIIQHAVFQGYSQRLVGGQFPIAVVLISVPFDQVDVNVHPTKGEVRFTGQHQIHEAVKVAVAQTLEEIDRPQWRPRTWHPSAKSREFSALSDSVASYQKVEDRGQKVEDRGQRAEDRGQRAEDRFQTTLSYNQYPRPDSQRPAQQSPVWPKKRFRDLRMIGQFRNSYIVCESDEGLILIDQHAAHERILFEHLRDQSAKVEKAAQQLLVPETIDLGFRESGVLEKLIPDLKSLGLDIEHFGGNTFVVKSVPAPLTGRDVNPLIIEMVENMVAVGYAPGPQKALEQCCMIMACHGAIRANQQLSDEQINGLLKQLDSCDNPSHCPHGRPTWIRWDVKTLEKSFKRIV
ncbi:MAG: DNA mismatch repair endonuclease MutL [Desulfobacterales bacterium]|nr:MAG: DNA mismatch repair endonuclease MutL [Desulfobacterales bacterium]